MSASAIDDRARYRAKPSVLDALKSPRMLTREVLAGLVVGLALIPEAIAFSVIAGVDPKVGLFSSFIMAVSIAFLGGRPAMVTAATGAVALVIAPVAPTYGLDYFIATVILAGVFQVILGVLGVAKLMRFIPRSVMVGFVNALAIFVFSSQFPQLIDVPWLVYPLVALGIVVMIVMPKITRIVPAPLVSVIIVTAVVLTMGLTVPTVGDQGELPQSLPSLFLPDIPWTWETFGIIAPFALGVALVGLMESLLTAKLVDEITDTHSNKSRESWAQGIANMLSGFFGGMGGCAVIGQTMINVKASGARTRISTFFAGIFLFLLVVVFGDFVGTIPMAALVAVMIMVAIGAFDWHSIKPSTLKRMPKSETFVMIATVVLVLLTHNLAVGVVGGVLVASVLFVRRVAHFVSVSRTVAGDAVTYTVTGELFFASSNDMTTLFSYSEDPDRIVIDLTGSHIWDASTVAALDAIETKYAALGKTVEIVGMNESSQRMRGRLTGGFE
ncbi:SulP family inorganic anion transporter [Microbacterium sp.]|uniref:SulP family inorganic anion transporter n=1 Tax=Microbacterium sp. TaxID=51671 RepID=UPI0028988828|nr:SulP family inorganic anion transporter [Microbacterium sp.]